ncbi:hypothetical protein OG792_19450 [Micromonospora sp. NBC_01699]|uniref:hypothetical protein n=1 Tax=Micromonospora sp. NBC_01699 TaxID=2975984 RepID=UPI002E2C7379|nr:hypothetical protein [Micromonospora sp. NBC_01699]
MDRWLALLDELLARPFPAGADRAEQPAPHHIDLRVSQDFYDDETRDETIGPLYAEFQAERDRLAHAISLRYGPAQQKDLQPYFDSEPPPSEPGSALFSYLSEWFFEVDLWKLGDRGIVVEVGHQDKELPLQLMLVVGDLSSGPVTS